MPPKTCPKTVLPDVRSVLPERLLPGRVPPNSLNRLADAANYSRAPVDYERPPKSFRTSTVGFIVLPDGNNNYRAKLFLHSGADQ
jgi:hypothetical protein